MASPSDAADLPPVVLFGYDSSTFTLKVRLALRLKQIPYTFVAVPTMMPRPLLRDAFHLTYRKIPILAIGREVYCDSSIILEALEHFFPVEEGWGTLFPKAADGRDYRPLMRGFASYWTDRPLFRVACGLMPASIWRSAFGRDRAGLIGHALDADKLEAKIPENLARLDLQLSMFEPLFDRGRDDGDGGSPWMFSTPAPSLADLSLYYELRWASDVASGRTTEGLTQGETKDGELEGASPVFNARRYPQLYAWYRMAERYFENLPDVETRAKDGEFEEVKGRMKAAPALGRKSLLLPTPRSTIPELDAKCGLVEGAVVSVVPDDTGRDDPTIGTLVALSPEEVVIKPIELEKPAQIDVRIHFPRLGFVTRPYKKKEDAAKL